MGLPVDVDVPLLCATSRVTFQKGFELILKILDPLMRRDIQLIIIGAGDKKYINELKKFERKHPNKLVVIPSHDENQKYETLVYSGSDFFMLPSHHEPCGINQLIAMRYGCVPIVRKVGGLTDTVENYNPTTGDGTGFTFSMFDEFSLFGAIIRAIENYKHKRDWKHLVVQTMKQSSSWEIPAKNYISLFCKTIKQNSGKNRLGV